MGKKGAWAHLLEGTRSDVIIALETWHNNTIRNNKLEVTCYTIYRRDWPNGRGGGALIAVTDNIRSSAMPTNTLSDQLWVKLSCCRHRDLLVGAFYRQKFLIRHWYQNYSLPWKFLPTAELTTSSWVETSISLVVIGKPSHSSQTFHILPFTMISSNLPTALS